MTEVPRIDRPYMPGYGVRPAPEGTGLLPWAWAVQRLAASHGYWLATTGRDGRAHLMPVWAVWLEEAPWFSCSNGSRKTKKLRAEPWCSLATDNPQQPVVVDSRSTRRGERTHLPPSALSCRIAGGWSAARARFERVKNLSRQHLGGVQDFDTD